MKTKRRLFLFHMAFSFIVLGAAKVCGQENQLKIYKAPNANIADINIQTHRGLLRFGAIDETKYKEKSWEINYTHFMGLMDIHSKGDVKSPLKKEWLSEEGRNTIEAIRNNGKSQIEQKKEFQNFMGKNLADLKGWPGTIFTNNALEAYYVTQETITEYDFDNGGILLSLGFHNIDDDNRVLYNLMKRRKMAHLNMRQGTNYQLSGGFLSQKHMVTSVKGDLTYMSKNSYERTVDVDNMIVFFEIGEDEANTILNNGKVFIVRKIAITPNGMFHINSPIIDIYADKALTRKVGQLDYTNLIFF